MQQAQIQPSRFLKRKDEVLLALVWAVLYIPYVIQGGWVRDDLALLTSTRGVQHYVQFQWFVSANRDMTARPVSALLHGLSYWLLGNDPRPYHALNLALFGASVLLFYLAVKKLISREVAWISALLALVYPCASTTTFSSIMMNSNLAAFFWSSGLYVSAGDFRWKHLLATALFVMSALSYEVFIPLFAFGTLVNIFFNRLHRLDRQRLLLDALPMLVAVGVYGIYRGLLERAIFHTTFSRIVLAASPVLLGKFATSLVSGLKIALVDSLVLSVRGLVNLDLLPFVYLAILLASLEQLGAHLYKSRSTDASGDSGGKSHYLALLGLAVCLFGLAHLIYTFSNYVPESVAFNNRTLGGLRFVTAFAIAAFAVPLYRGLAGRRAAQLAALFLVAVFSLFTISTVGQSQAWILAGRWNEQTVRDITQAIRTEHIDPAAPLTLVAVLPGNFRGQINQEPMLGVAWDITPLLSLRNPDLVISSNVYNPSAAAGAEGVTIQNFDHPWQGMYPLWLYDYANHKLYRVTSQVDWNSDLSLAVPSADP